MSSLPEVLRTCLTLITPSERRAAVFILAAACFAAILEAVAVGSTLPFFRLLQMPKPIVPEDLRPIVFSLYDFVGKRPRVASGLIVVALVLISNITSFAVTRVQLRAVHLLGHRIAVRLLRTYFAVPYERFVQMDVAKTSKHVLHDSEQLVNGLFKPLGHIVTSGSVMFALLLLLVFLSPMLSFLAVVVLAGCYGAVFVALRRGVQRAGAHAIETNRVRFKVVGEAFGGAKEIRVGGNALTFVARFARASRAYALQSAQKHLLQLAPRFVIDLFAVTGAVTIAIVLAARDRNVTVMLPTLGLFAFAGYRVLPHFQQVVANTMLLRAHLPMLRDVARELNETHAAPAPSVPPMPFEGVAELRSVTVQYAGQERPAISDVSLTVPRGGVVAIVGKTGGGKSTVADVFLGLVAPTSGELVVDGLVIDDSNRASWQANIGYVPQRVYLADDTIRSNIAFGIHPKEVDEEALREAARLAHIDEFVQALPAGYDTVIGERGVRLSGGQQQRVGIARALYRKPRVLVLDEATSDLDTVTQAAIGVSLRTLADRPTIVLIAHRMEAVEASDIIYVLDRGRIVGRGTYAEMQRDVPEFHALTAARADSSYR